MNPLTKNLFKMMAVVSVLGMFSGAQAADDIYLGIPGYGGSGCPAGHL